jgi:DedD protein
LNQAMRQRLVGTLVLGSLAIILIPLLLDGDGIQAPPLSATIPPKPELDTSPIAEPVRPAITADTQPAPGSELPAEPATTTAVTTTDAVSTPTPLPAFDDKEAAAAPATATAGNATTGKATADKEPDALEAAVAAIMAKESAGTTKATPDSVPRLDSSGLPLSYVVRLGSFGDKANADALVKKLVAADYKAYTRPVTNANATLTAVYVGPVLTRAEANSMVTRLANGFALNGVVETFSAQPAQKAGQ